MKLFQRILSNISLFIVVLLLFLLIFQNKVSLPAFFQSIGRMHPMLLHLPIGLLLLSILFWFFRKNIEPESFQKLFFLLLNVTAFTALLTALMGFFLSKEGGYDEVILGKHKFLGVTTAISAYVIMLLYKAIPEKKKLFSLVLVTNGIFLIVAGHFGSNLTHGEGFVFKPLQKEEESIDEKITDSSSLFAAAVRPILKAKCFTCHNERKAKGGLVMTSMEKILSGGKDGPIWKAGDPVNSHIIQKINLPAEDKKHMPPQGKAQLSSDEKDFLYAWIQFGANIEKQLREYADTDSLKEIALKFIRLPEEFVKEKEYPFDMASAATIQKLNDPFLSVFPISQNSPALQADFFIKEKFNVKKLEGLLKVKDQLVSLSLNKMPVTDGDMKIISRFTNLEKLFLNNSAITNKGLRELINLKNLQLLSLAGTRIDKVAISTLIQLTSLSEAFIWNTGISINDVKAAQQQSKTIMFNTGYMPDAGEVLTLTTPSLKNEEFVLSGNETIELKHQIPGVVIRYTTDGSLPDSTTSAIYKEPIKTSGFAIIKARAIKPGWYSSPVSEFSFFKKGVEVQKAELLSAPNEKYKGNGATTLIDGKKGISDNFTENSWLGFKEDPMIALFYFDNPQPINSISISYNKKVQSYIMPPVEVEVWGGDDKNKLKLLKKIKPPQATKEELNVNRIEGLMINIPPTYAHYYKLVAKNIPKLPSWHPGKGDKGWVFIDEIFFNN